MILCAYCRRMPGATADHVVPRSYRRRAELPKRLRGTVRACWECNLRKGNRRLLPSSWADRVDQLNDLLPGTPWRTWDGSTTSPAYREVWV